MYSLILATLLTTGATVPDLFSFSSEKSLADPSQEKKAEPADKGRLRTIIIPFGNRILIISDDPEVLDKVQIIIRMMCESPSGSEAFQVFPLTNTASVGVARILDKWFNGRRQAQNQHPEGRGGDTVPMP